MAPPRISFILTLLEPIQTHPFLSFLLCICGYVTYQRYLHPLSKFPGPFSASLTNLWRSLENKSGKSHLNDFARLKKYGPVFRDGPNSLIFSDPKALPVIYGTKGGLGEFSKSKWYKIFHSDSTEETCTMFAERSPERHRMLKKRINHLFSSSTVSQYSDVVENLVQDWIEQLRVRQTVDFGLWSQLLTFDIITEIAYGRRMGFIEKGADVDGYVRAMDIGYRMLAIVGPLTSLVAFMKWRRSSNKPKPIIQGDVMSAMRNNTQKVVLDLVSSEGTAPAKPSLAQGLLDAVKSKEPNIESVKTYVYHELISNLNAASHSTAVALTAIVFYAAKHAEVQQKLREEIQLAESLGNISSPAKFQEASSLPYLTALIKESMRLYPSFTVAWPREVPKGGCEIAGVFVPGGTDVGVPAYVSNRDKDVFGEDAEEFRPERWLPLDSGRSKEMEKWMFTFGFANGSRGCMGKHLALLEINLAVLEVFRTFRVQLVSPDVQLEDLDRSFLHNIIDGLFITFTPV